MSFFSSVEKIIRYIPVVRTVVDIIVGAYRGIKDAVTNPQVDKVKFEIDNSTGQARIISSSQAEKEYEDFLNNIRSSK